MRRHSRFSRAQMIVVLTLALPTLLAGVGLSADLGVLYFNWVELQKAADAGALAGAQYLASPAPSPQSMPSPAANCPPGGGQDANAQSAACTYSTYNGALASEVSSTINPSNVPASVPAGVNTIQVLLNRPKVQTYFLRLLGIDSLGVKAAAMAMAPTCINNGGNGLFPIGMPATDTNNNTITYTNGQTVTLIEGVSSGNWEWLNIPSDYTAPACPATTTNSGGNSQLASTITTGCVDCSISVNSCVTPQTGYQNSKPVTTAIADRITSEANVTSTNGVQITNTGPGTWSNSGPPTDNGLQATTSNPPDPSLIPNGAPAYVTIPIVNWTTTNGGSATGEVTGIAVAWLDSFVQGGKNNQLTVTFINGSSNIQTGGGTCTSQSPPGLTQAELVQ